MFLFVCALAVVVVCYLYMVFFVFFFFFKQKTAYEMRISDWSSDVCSSDLLAGATTVEHKQLFALADELSCIVGRHTPILMHANLNIPGCPRPLGRHQIRQEFVQRAQDQIWHEVP